MCTSPIKIFNRSRRFRVGIDLPILTVPCGHCEECQKKAQKDWFVRASAEYMRIKEKKGFVWFPTLTFNDSNMLIWDDSDNNYTVPVFNHDAFVSFRNKLRIYLKREGYNLSGENTMRFFYASEYGGKFGRPHFHCLLFVPMQIPYDIFAQCVDKAWIYGFVMYSKKYGRTIKGIKGIQYVMKYIHKDCHYYDLYKIDKYISSLKDKIKLLPDGNEDKEYLKNKLSMFKKCLPSHHQSMGFGSSFQFTDDEYINNKVRSNRLGIFDKDFSYSIPMYYKRKFLYDFDKVDSIYNINPRGKHIKLAQLNILIDKLDMYLSSSIYSNSVEDLCKRLFPHLLDNPLYDYFKDLRNYDTKDIAVYSLIYDGLPVYKDTFEVLNNDLSKSQSNFFNDRKRSAYFIWCKRIDNLYYPPEDDYKNNGSIDSVKLVGYRDLPVYKIFFYGLMFLAMFEKEFGKLSNDAALKEYYNEQVQFGKLFARTL